jgi:hypothetical protein
MSRRGDRIHGYKSSVKADAEFLEYAAKEQLDVAPISNHDTSATNTAASSSLHRSNLLKLQTDELIEECCNGGNNNNNSTKKLGGNVVSSRELPMLGSLKWYNIAEQYTDTINYIIHNHMPAITLNSKGTKTPFSHFADRSASVTINDCEATKLSIYQGYRHIESSGILHQLGHNTNASSGNAHVIPIIERTIVIPNQLFTCPEQENSSTSVSSNKDYLRFRYTDVRLHNVLEKLR